MISSEISTGGCLRTCNTGMSAGMLGRICPHKLEDWVELEIKLSGVHPMASVPIATSTSLESSSADQKIVRSRSLFPGKMAMFKRRLYLTRNRVDY